MLLSHAASLIQGSQAGFKEVDNIGLKVAYLLAQ
jgi:hypothetical protein